MNLLKSNFQFWNNVISASDGCAKALPHLLLPYMFDLQYGIKTQFLDYEKKHTILWSTIQNLRKSWKNTQLCEIQGWQGGSTKENLQVNF